MVLRDDRALVVEFDARQGYFSWVAPGDAGLVSAGFRDFEEPLLCRCKFLRVDPKARTETNARISEDIAPAVQRYELHLLLCQICTENRIERT
jgi:hypothetical protein